MGLAGLAVSIAFAGAVYQDLTLAGFYFCVLVFGLGIAEIVLRGISPVKGLVGLGLGFLMIVSGVFTFAIQSFNTSPKEFIIQQLEKSADKIAEQKKMIELSGDKDSIQVLQLLDNPDLLASEIIESFPSYIFIAVFLMLWFNMFMVLKSRRLLNSGQSYPYDEKNLLNFKMPFGFVLVLVLGLVLATWGSSLGSNNYESLGVTMLKCLGVFYFFQGFGVYSDLLNFLNIKGFLRTILVMMTLVMANYLIAIAGLFDNWFDFRKYFVKRKTEE